MFRYLRDFVIKESSREMDIGKQEAVPARCKLFILATLPPLGAATMIPFVLSSVLDSSDSLGIGPL